MILAVDDDNAVLEFIEEYLGREGFQIKTFNNANLALVFAEKQEPELIISDVMMPEMGGFDFKAAYAQKFPNRLTPFIFMSSLGSTEDMVRGLEVGADDYLTKPVPAPLLVAKVKSYQRKRMIYTSPTFIGDLEKFPFVKVMQFCEVKGLNGKVEIQSEALHTMIHFKAGQVDLEVSGDDDLFEKLFDLEKGTFIVHSAPVDFTEIEGASYQPKPSQKTEVVDKPMGTLSGIKAKDKLFQIQTEFVTHPENQIVSIVILDGKTVMKKTGAVSTSDRKLLEKAIREQHAKVEAEVRDRLESLSAKKSKEEESPADIFNRIFQQGMDKYLDHDYPAALELWESAAEIDPNNQMLEMNLKIVRKKL